MRDRNLKTIFLVSGIFSRKADSVILLGIECIIKTQNLIKIVGAIFEKMEILNFFLCELPLIFGVARKRNEQAENICKGTPDVEFEQDWSVGSGAALGDGKKLKIFFSFQGFFRENSLVSHCWVSNVLLIHKI